MTINCSGMTVGAQRRIATGIREVSESCLPGEPLPSDTCWWTVPGVDLGLLRRALSGVMQCDEEVR